jgi:hypothetical protein
MVETEDAGVKIDMPEDSAKGRGLFENHFIICLFQNRDLIQFQV